MNLKNILYIYGQLYHIKIWNNIIMKLWEILNQVKWIKFLKYDQNYMIPKKSLNYIKQVRRIFMTAI